MTRKYNHMNNAQRHLATLYDKARCRIGGRRLGIYLEVSDMLDKPALTAERGPDYDTLCARLQRIALNDPQ